MTDWWLDELTTAGPEHLDQDYVAGYDTKAQFDPSGEIDRLRAFGLNETSTLIDLGAGTGALSFAAATLGASVIAVDVSPAMVAAMESRAGEGAGAGGDRPVPTVVRAGLLSYRHQGPPADFVFSRNVLHQLPDFWKVVALDRLSHLLRPGGILRLLDLVFDLEPDQVETGVETWMGRAADDPARGYTAPDFADHLRTEHSTFTWLLEPMLERAGFEIIEREIRASVYASYTCRVPLDQPVGSSTQRR